MAWAASTKYSELVAMSASACFTASRSLSRVLAAP